jgi:fluoroacetyl-CoA thioesterase
MPLEPGLTHEHRFEVTDELSTDVGGSVANRVLATPRMIGQMEYTAMQAVWSDLPAGATCVGFAVNIKHVASAPVGGQCVSVATLTDVQDDRKLHFDVEVKYDGRTVGVGTHERRIIHGSTFDGRNATANGDSGPTS